MNVCVAGWYFHAPFLEMLSKQEDHQEFMVCHRLPNGVELRGSPFSLIRNVGLEFGCYDWYLKNEWPGGDTLFIHDDTEITEEALDQIATIPHDQCFLFGKQEEIAANGKAHGRAVFCSNKLLRRLKTDGGFWYDEGPTTGAAIPATTADAPAYHNAGILTFVAWLRSLPQEFSVNRVGVVPALKTGYRGRL